MNPSKETHQESIISRTAAPLRALGMALFLGILLVPGASQARDLQGRLGLGYNAQFSNYPLPNGVPGISLKYAPSRDFALGLIAGVSTGKPGNSVVGGKLFKNVFLETNLNFYFMGAFALLSGNNKSGYEGQVGAGAEFFIPGIESLGFSMEFGGSLTNISGTTLLKTIGFNFLNAGIHFYF